MVSRQEIEEAIKNKDDFIKISYLNRFLKQADNMDIKKYVLLNLAAINEKKGLLSDAIKNVTTAADISLTYREKRELYIKEIELWIKYGDFIMAEKALHKTYGYCSEKEKNEVENQYHELFRVRGNILESQGKLRNAVDIYEKLLGITKSVPKKMELKEKLLNLYDKTGRIREHSRLKDRQF